MNISFFSFIFLFVLIFPIVGHAQIKLTENGEILTEEIEIFNGIDTFENIYYTNKNIFYKKSSQKTWQYSDFQLGELTQVSIINPLKIILFYKQTNTIVLVDKFLSEINRISFNFANDFKSVSQAAPANDQTLWIFNDTTLQLELFNYLTNQTTFISQSFQEIPFYTTSNFNNIWCITKSSLLHYNRYGSLLQRIENTEYNKLHEYNNYIILHKNDSLYSIDLESSIIQKLKLPEIPVKQFYVTNEILYIYHKSKIYRFGLKS